MYCNFVSVGIITNLIYMYTVYNFKSNIIPLYILKIMIIVNIRCNVISICNAFY